MELKPNMYVRTKIYITKIDKIDNNKTVWKYKVDKKDSGDGTFEYRALRDEDIVKASHNIIDLIDVGDYVNGEKVVRIEKDSFIKGQINLWTNTTTTNYWGDISLSPIIEKDIKSIVTSEQFKAMEYVVGGSDE